MSEVSNIDIARSFFDAHRLSFERASIATTSDARRFNFTAAQFDDWAVGSGYMPMAARDGDVLERRGLTKIRQDLRTRLNRVARKGQGISRAFSVEARGGKWRVVLIERFLEEQPHEIIQALAKTQDNALRRVTSLKGQANEAEHLSDTERTLVLARLEGAEAAISFGMQQVEFAVHQIHPDAKMPDFRKLRRQMSELMRAAFYGKPAKLKAKTRPKKALQAGSVKLL